MEISHFTKSSAFGGMVLAQRPVSDSKRQHSLSGFSFNLLVDNQKLLHKYWQLHTIKEKRSHIHRSIQAYAVQLMMGKRSPLLSFLLKLYCTRECRILPQGSQLLYRMGFLKHLAAKFNLQ